MRNIRRADDYSYHYDNDNRVLTIYEKNEVLCTIPEVEVTEVDTMFSEAVWELREVNVDEI